MGSHVHKFILYQLQIKLQAKIFPLRNYTVVYCTVYLCMTLVVMTSFHFMMISQLNNGVQQCCTGSQAVTQIIH